MSEAVLRLRDTIDVSGVRLQTPPAGDHFVRVANGDEDHRLLFQIAPERIVYQHTRSDPAGSELDEIQRRLTDHLSLVATPIITSARGIFESRIQKVGIGYELVFEFEREPGVRRNIDALTSHLVAGLKPHLQHVLREPWMQLGRLDLKVGVDHEIAGRPTELWFDLECPGNADYTRIEATVSIQSRSGQPSKFSEWALAPAEVHDAVWPTVERFFQQLGE